MEALDDLAREVRLSTLVQVLALGTSALDHVDAKPQASEVTNRRQARLNKVRAEIRAGLGIEEGS